MDPTPTSTIGARTGATVSIQPGTTAISSIYRLSPILRIQSGRYLNVFTDTDVGLNTIEDQRLNQVLDDVYGSKTVTDYLNPAAFALPATGTRGSMGRAAILGPGTWQLDVALSRVFRIGEVQQLELRAEAFNLTNSFRMEGVETEFDDSRFGEVTSARDPRIMQFALKYLSRASGRLYLRCARPRVVGAGRVPTPKTYD